MSQVKKFNSNIKNIYDYYLINLIFPDRNYKKPISIIGYNNAGKTNLITVILYGTGINYINENTFELKDIHNLDEEKRMNTISNLDSSFYMNSQKVFYMKTIKNIFIKEFFVI